MTVRASTNGDQVPLSVLLFHAAMGRGMGMSAYAKELGIGPLSLRHFIQGKTQRPRDKTFDLIASNLDMPVDAVRRQAALPPPSGPEFADWLQAQMDGRYSRARLAKETGISDGALRNYLDGRTLPDADQAQRLAEALGAPPMEIAHIIIAGQAAQGDDDEALEEASIAANGAVPITSAILAPPPAEAPAPITPALPVASTFAVPVEMAAPMPTKVTNSDDERLLNLWRQLHPQGRRATLIYIAGLLAES
jgi:transcriptional regulator with XRE-family HTH domain